MPPPTRAISDACSKSATSSPSFRPAMAATSPAGPAPTIAMRRARRDAIFTDAAADEDGPVARPAVVAVALTSRAAYRARRERSPARPVPLAAARVLPRRVAGRARDVDVDSARAEDHVQPQHGRPARS